MNIKKVVWSIYAVAAASVLCAAMAASAWAENEVGINEKAYSLP